MRLHSFDMRAAKVSRLAAAGLFGLALSCAAAAIFAVRSLHDPLTDAPPEAARAWRPPTFSLEAPQDSKRAQSDVATLARPVFSKSRRPTGKAEGGVALGNVAPMPAPADLSLRAVVRFAGKTSVFIVSPAFAEGKWFGVGETLDGWTIKEERPGGVSLSNGAQSTPLEFNFEDRGKSEAGMLPPQPPPGFEAPPPPPGGVEAPPQPPNGVRGRRGRPA